MAFLSSVDLEPRGEEIFIENYDRRQVDRAAYNLRLGTDVFVSTKERPDLLEKETDTVAIHPGEFALLTTYERVRIPQGLLALITVRHRYKKQGLMNVSGFHVDPGFEGNLVFSVFNVGRNDIVLRHQEAVFMIFFAELKSEDAGNKKLTHDKQRRFSLEDMLAIRGPSASLVYLEGRVKELEGNLKFYGAIVTGLLVTLFAFVINLLLRSSH